MQPLILSVNNYRYNVYLEIFTRRKTSPISRRLLSLAKSYLNVSFILLHAKLKLREPTLFKELFTTTQPPKECRRRIVVSFILHQFNRQS